MVFIQKISMNTENIRILLIQIRKDHTKAHEFEILVRDTGFAPEQIVSHDVFIDPRMEMDALRAYDAVIIGGSGAQSVTKPGEYLPYLEDIVRFCKEEKIPFLGLCFGFQVAVKAFGGTVVNDREHMETGTYLMRRTPESDADPLVGSLPREFMAGCGRQDRAETLPPGMVNYVSSDLCPYHYAVFPDAPFFITQFHPELWKKEDNVKRVIAFQEKYGMSDEALQEQLALFDDAPESRFIITNFIEKVVAPYHAQRVSAAAAA